MHMFDFHSKLMSPNEGGALFEALRSLSRIEDPREMFGFDGPIIPPGEWPAWPAMDAHASNTASE